MLPFCELLWKSVQSLKLSECQTVRVFHWSCSSNHFGSDVSLKRCDYEKIWLQGWENWVYLPLWYFCADCCASTSQFGLSLSFLYWLQLIRFLKKRKNSIMLLLLVKNVGVFLLTLRSVYAMSVCFYVLIPLSFYGCFSGKCQLQRLCIYQSLKLYQQIFICSVWSAKHIILLTYAIKTNIICMPGYECACLMTYYRICCTVWNFIDQSSVRFFFFFGNWVVLQYLEALNLVKIL